MSGSATFTIVASSTTISWLMASDEQGQALVDVAAVGVGQRVPRVRGRSAMVTRSSSCGALAQRP